MKTKVLFITSNLGKVAEANAILGSNFEVSNIDIDVPEIQSVDVKEVTKFKIETAYERVKDKYGEDVNVICEDTGLHFDNMGGFPGALIKYYLTSINPEGIAKHNGGSKAKAVTVVGVKNSKGTHLFVGETTGTVAEKISDKAVQGFGWDPVFIPDYPKEYSEYDGKTYAEIPKEVKNKISQRFKAFTKFAEFFGIKPAEGKKAKKSTKKTSKKQAKKSSKKKTS